MTNWADKLRELHGVSSSCDARQSFTTTGRNLIGTDEKAEEATTVWTELQSVAVLHAEFRLGPIESTTRRCVFNIKIEVKLVDTLIASVSGIDWMAPGKFD